jgi:Cys-tRNA(Pro)/Cys-tRNA(Cys) deacylase
MSKTTRATQALTAAGIVFTVHTYDYDPNADRVGLQAADALGEHAGRVLKTLMAEVDGRPVCAVVPSDREVSMKKLAAAFGGKAANMMKPTDAERLTGYHVGGISPFGQKKAVPTAIEVAVLDEALVYVNGGQRGLQVRLAPQDALKALGASAASLVA